MGKICWINGQPYLVSLSMGGKSGDDFNNPWDRLIAFLGENCDDVFHWWEMYSWCQESVGKVRRAGRGYYSASNWSYIDATYQGTDVGFRPVLVPLNPATMKPDPSIMDDIPDGSRFALASLYMDGKVIAEPQNPTSKGDIANWIPGTEITLGDRDEDPKNWLHVIKYRDLLWADRVLLKHISWYDLEEQGFTGEN